MSGAHGRDSDSCRELFAQLSEYLDDELDPRACTGIESHLADCPPCRAFLESLRRTVGLTRLLPDHELPEDMRRELVEAYREIRKRQK